MAEKEELGTFWDHLDALRSILFKIIIAVMVFTIIAFGFKEILSDIVMAPKNSDFISYRIMGRLGDMLNMPFIKPQDFHVEMINTKLASQFLIHMKMALMMAVLLSALSASSRILEILKSSKYSILPSLRQHIMR